MTPWVPPDLGPLHELALDSLVNSNVDDSDPSWASFFATAVGERSFQQMAPTLTSAAALLRFILGTDRIDPVFQSIPNLKLLLETHGELLVQLKTSWEQRDFTRLKSFAFWYIRPMSTGSEGHRAGTVMNTQLQRKALSSAWNFPYTGDLHKVLIININYEFKRRKRRTRGNHACLIQGSGSGKSRTVDKLSTLVFTLPFNLRLTDNRYTCSYPDADDVVRDHILSAAWLSSAEQHLFWQTFFYAAFDDISERVSRLEADGICYEDLAKLWSEFLHANRSSIYREIVRRHREQWQFTAMHHVSGPVIGNLVKTQDMASNARAASKRLLKVIDESVRESERRIWKGRVKIVCSFDEADVLALTKVPDNDQEGNLYDVLCTSLDVFRGIPIFFLFLSTNSQIALLAPPKSRLKSKDARHHFASLIPPFTETPFDCSPDFPLKRTSYDLSYISSIRFMANFGRPLWRSLMDAMKSEHQPIQGPLSESQIRVTRARKKKIDAFENAKDGGAGPFAPNPIAAEIMPLARTKLLSCDVLPTVNDVQAVQQFYNPLRKRVLADIRVSLNYEPSREKTYDEFANMVASHMRTVFSVPQHREYMRSGYPSEPVLAEAAAQELRVLRSSGIDGATTLPEIVANAMDSELCSVGERGEVVGRTLLTIAHDRAVERESKSSDGSVKYSDGCSLTGFIQELFPGNIAEQILGSHPDNTMTDQTMKEAFGNAHVRFTHFARLGDDGGITPQALFAAFLRGHAQLGHPTQEKIDVVIPVALDKNNICMEKMTVLLISIKRRAMEGSKAEYEVCADALGVFVKSFVTSHRDHPYIALVMELGVQGRARYTLGPRHIRRPSAGAGLGGLDGFARPAPAAPSNAMPQSPLRVALGQFGDRRADLRGQNEPPKHHPRYNIYAYGCSPDIYKVIGEDERGLYRKLLADRDILVEHPRNKLRGSIRAMLRQKPILYTNRDSYNWIDLVPNTTTTSQLAEVQEERTFGPDAVFTGKATAICDALEEQHLFSFVFNVNEKNAKDNRKSGVKMAADFHHGGHPPDSAASVTEYIETYDTEPEDQENEFDEDEDDDFYGDIFAEEDRQMEEQSARRREKGSLASQIGPSKAKPGTSAAKASTSEAKSGTSETGRSRGGKSRSGKSKAGRSEDGTLSSVVESSWEEQEVDEVELRLNDEAAKKQEAKRGESTNKKARSSKGKGRAL